MSKIHALESTENGCYRVVLHVPMPTGNNTVGKSWQSIWLAIGGAVSSLDEGILPGQITNSEKNDIEAGNVIEISDVVPVDVVKNGVAALNAFVDEIIAGAIAKLKLSYAYYGWTNG